jgi:HIV Tat-specific factor 1
MITRTKPPGNNNDDDDAPLANFLDEIKSIEEQHTVPGDDNIELPLPEEQSFIDDDGTKYQWDSSLGKFMPIDEEGDAGEGGDGDDPNNTVAPFAAPSYRPEDMIYAPDADAGKGRAKKQKLEEFDDATEGEGEAGGMAINIIDDDGDGATHLEKKRKLALEEAGQRVKRAKEQQKQGWFQLKKNTSIYIEGLPDDVTVEEVGQVFSKCGIIKEDEYRQPRIKLYIDQETGVFKGDGLVTYLKEPSIDLAIQLYDDTQFRYGCGRNMKISRAKFEQKGGEFKSNKPPASGSDAFLKKKIVAAQESRALDWAGWDDDLKPEQITVILKRVFHPDEFIEDPELEADLKRDILGEASKLGVVENMKIYRRNPDGVVSIVFKTEVAADACIKLMRGRWFGGRQLEADKWDGVTNHNTKRVQETEEEQMARLEAFSKEIEGREGGGGGEEEE